MSACETGRLCICEWYFVRERESMCVCVYMYIYMSLCVRERESKKLRVCACDLQGLLPSVSLYICVLTITLGNDVPLVEFMYLIFICMQTNLF